jgi:endonuclease/exonuclease/phosphatase family metal-dependent hydrolase
MTVCNTSKTIRIMTYNVHSCRGTDSKVSPFLIAEVIAQYEPDIVALQEVDVGRARTGRVDQAEVIANHLNMDFHFHPTIQIEEERYGNAILSRYPMHLAGAGSLPTFPRLRPLERRGALRSTIHIGSRKIQIINTHLGLDRRERLLQAEALLGSDWLAHPTCQPPFVICGDFNARPGSTVYRRFRKMLLDAQHCLTGSQPLNTWPTLYPLIRIDHAFISPQIRVRSVEAPRTRLTRIASDHLPLIVEISI